MTTAYFATPTTPSLLDRAIFASVSIMSVFALVSPLLSLGT